MFLHIIQRPHPTPILQGESCANLIIPKNIGKTKKKNKEGKAKNNKNHWENQKENKKKTFRPMSTLADLGPKVLLFLFVLVFPMVFDGFGIDLFGFFFFGFPNGF